MKGRKRQKETEKWNDFNLKTEYRLFVLNNFVFCSLSLSLMRIFEAICFDHFYHFDRPSTALAQDKQSDRRERQKTKKIKT